MISREEESKRASEFLRAQQKYREYSHVLRPILDQVNEDMREKSKKLRVMLNNREYEILKKRIWEKKTLEEVGAEFSVTRERILQIERKTYEKLKAKI